MKPAIYLFICLAILSSCSQAQTLKDEMIHNYLKEDFVFMEDRLKYEMVVFESQANENPEKYGAALDMSRIVSNSSHNFSTQVDSLLKRGQITSGEMDSLFSTYTITMQEFQKLVSDSPKFVIFIKQMSEPFPDGYSPEYGLNATVLRNQLVRTATEVIGYLMHDVHAEGFGFCCEINFATQKFESNNTTTISLSSKPIQQFPHKYIFVNEIIQNGKPTTSIKYKATTNTDFGQITLDSLPPANYEIRGQVRGVAANDRYYEEDFSYAFDIE